MKTATMRIPAILAELEGEREWGSGREGKRAGVADWQGEEHKNGASQGQGFEQ